jgi:hypothetical protein
MAINIQNNIVLPQLDSTTKVYIAVNKKYNKPKLIENDSLYNLVYVILAYKLCELELYNFVI